MKMVQLTTLVKISVGMGGAVAAFGLYTRYNVSDKFSQQPYYVKGIELLEGYDAATDRLGKPLTYKKVDIADAFNYHDETLARAKIPVTGTLRKGELMVYAHRANKDNDWWIDKLELAFKGSGLKYKFYDGAFNKPKNLDANNAPIPPPPTASKTAVETEYVK